MSFEILDLDTQRTISGRARRVSMESSTTGCLLRLEIVDPLLEGSLAEQPWSAWQNQGRCLLIATDAFGWKRGRLHHWQLTSKPELCLSLDWLIQDSSTPRASFQEKTKQVFPESSVRVNQGESLLDLAVRVYGEAGQWTRIARANGITDPRALQAGQRLRLPAWRRGL